MLENEVMTCNRDSRINLDNAHGKNMKFCIFAYGLTAGQDYYILQPEMNLLSESSNYITYIFTNLSNY